MTTNYYASSIALNAWMDEREMDLDEQRRRQPAAPLPIKTVAERIDEIRVFRQMWVAWEFPDMVQECDDMITSLLSRNPTQ